MAYAASELLNGVGGISRCNSRAFRREKGLSIAGESASVRPSVVCNGVLSDNPAGGIDAALLVNAGERDRGYLTNCRRDCGRSPPVSPVNLGDDRSGMLVLRRGVDMDWLPTVNHRKSRHRLPR